MRRWMVGVGAAGVLSVGIVLGLLAGGSAIRPHATESGTDVTGLPNIFRDPADGLVLAVRLAANQGDFDLSVKDVGQYEGRVSVSQSGDNVFHLQGPVEGRFSSTGEIPWSSATLTFEGIVKPQTGDANVNIWVGDTKYHLQSTDGNDSDAVKVIDQLLNAFQAHDWATVYLLENADVTSSVSEDQFAQSLATQSPGEILAMTASAPAYRTSGMGFQYYVQPVTIQWQKPDGSTATFSSRVHLVLEQGTWRFLGTDPPPAS